ncbi:protein-tyrosine phosphatase-like protein [Lentinula raphanica]|uniref:protein-tyrosine-phosphatase n=1 Tax=Lentinula raphanica TaxID=153919 RepID=A0AA38UDU4_9AGAR|nr:protein-tyrosine phosphatase-like protein [Lentinula raphanica]KAJ3966816.1 protein-tyrosine phosphatase-like protein [Lentinula raphanica]
MSCAKVAIMVSSPLLIPFSVLSLLLQRIQTCILSSFVLLPILLQLLWSYTKTTYQFSRLLQPSGFSPHNSFHTMPYHDRSWSQTTKSSTNPNSNKALSSASTRLAPLSMVSHPSSTSPYPSPSPYNISSSPSQNPHRVGKSYHPPLPISRHTASEIIPRLYISDLSFAESPALLRKHHITHILSVLPENLSLPSDSELRSLLGYTPIRMQIRDVEDFPFAELAAHLPTTTGFIQNAFRTSPDSRVLVHCVEGISRSVSVVAAFLMAQYGWTPKEAVGYVKEKRTIANPNFGFVKQLYEYGREGLGRRSLVEGT